MTVLLICLEASITGPSLASKPPCPGRGGPLALPDPLPPCTPRLRLPPLPAGPS